MGRGLQILKGIASGIRRRQAKQPSLIAEAAAAYRQGREDLLGTLFGPLMGANREPGAPGMPTPQQTTRALEGQQVNLRQDRIVAPQPVKQAMKQKIKQPEMDKD